LFDSSSFLIENKVGEIFFCRSLCDKVSSCDDSVIASDNISLQHDSIGLSHIAVSSELSPLTNLDSDDSPPVSSLKDQENIQSFPPASRNAIFCECQNECPKDGTLDTDIVDEINSAANTESQDRASFNFLLESSPPINFGDLNTVELNYSLANSQKEISSDTFTNGVKTSSNDTMSYSEEYFGQPSELIQALLKLSYTTEDLTESHLSPYSRYPGTLIKPVSPSLNMLSLAALSVEHEETQFKDNFEPGALINSINMNYKSNQPTVIVSRSEARRLIALQHLISQVDETALLEFLLNQKQTE